MASVKSKPNRYEIVIYGFNHLYKCKYESTIQCRGSSRRN